MAGADRRDWPEVDGYELVGLLGRGGFGAVYEARQRSVDRQVAIKVLSATAFGPDTERRFRAECRSIGALSWHHHVVSLYDAGTTAEGELFLVMELVEGGSLGDALRQGRALDASSVADVGIEIADALSAAHDAGVLHRDVKPDNILIDRRGNHLLSDFGIATLDDGTRSTTGTFTGTYAYSAPEVLNGERASVRSDVYGLGATMHALATGRPPFASESDPSPAPMLLRIVSQPMPPLPESIPPELAVVIATAMAKDPADRYASAAEMRMALQARSTAPPVADDGETHRRTPLPPAVEEPAAEEPDTVLRPAPVAGYPEIIPSSRPRGQVIASVVVAAIALLVGVVVAMALLSGGGGGGDATSATTQPDESVDEPTTDIVDEASTRPPSEVQVVVLNGSGLAGVGSAASETIGQAGFNMDTVANANGLRSETTVYYGDGYEADAVAVALLLGLDPQVEPMAEGNLEGGEGDANVAVVLGEDTPPLDPSVSSSSTTTAG